MGPRRRFLRRNRWKCLVFGGRHLQDVRSHLAAARQGAPEGDFVGVFEISSHRKAAGEPRHTDASAQPIGEVGGSSLARHVRIGREHDLLDSVAFYAL